MVQFPFHSTQNHKARKVRHEFSHDVWSISVAEATCHMATRTHHTEGRSETMNRKCGVP